MSHKSNDMTRRGVLGAFATAGGGLMLHALATGIPARILLDPLSARADETLPEPKMLILSVSNQGDPVNANVPGTYEHADIVHPPDPAMAPTALTLSGQSHTAARPWAELPQEVLDRTVFFHHATYTPVHGELGRVQRMMGATERNDMLVSLLASEIGPRLGTIQNEPISLGANGAELLSAGGRVLGNVAPTSVRQALGGVDGVLKSMETLRDQHIDRIYALYREHGTPSQRQLLDRWARSRDEVRSVSTALLERLTTIDGNDQVNQARCAAILAAMKIAPIITIKLNFGRDNHNDTDLATETENHLLSVPQFGDLVRELDQLRSEGHLQHDVLVGSLNVFGRTLTGRGTTGRDHSSGHHVMVLSGPGIRGGVVGGVALNEAGNRFIAQPIDSSSGAVGGDIPYEETLGAMGKTLGVALGISEERVDQIVATGKVVRSVCA